MNRYLYFLPLLLLCFVACEEEPDPFPTDLGYDYYPLAVGKYRIYETDSIIFDPGGTGTLVDTFSGQIREEIVELFEDAAGDTLYRVERSYRRESGTPFRVIKVYTEQLDRQRQQLVRQEDNLRFIKMVFPVRENKRWNGNVNFDEFIRVLVAGESVEMFKGWSYNYERTTLDTTIATRDYVDVVHIELADSENVIENRQADEYYAPGIGLVYRTLDIQDTQCEICCNNDTEQCIDLPWVEKAEKGFSLRQRLIEHN